MSDRIKDYRLGRQEIQEEWNRGLLVCILVFSCNSVWNGDAERQKSVAMQLARPAVWRERGNELVCVKSIVTTFLRLRRYKLEPSTPRGEGRVRGGRF